MKALHVYNNRLCRITSSQTVGTFIVYEESGRSDLVHYTDVRPVTEEEQSRVDGGDSFASIERRMRGE